MELIKTFSIKFFYKPFDKMGIKPNQLTVLNFLTNSLTAVVFFAKGLPRIALLFCALQMILDHIDGELARKKFGGETDKGRWMDTSLDWLFYLLLIGGISYSVGQMGVGIICIIGTVFANYIDTKRRTIRLGGFPFSPGLFILFGAVFNQMTICLYLITFFAVLRASIFWKKSLEEKCKSIS